MSVSFQDLIVICATTVPAVSALFSKFWLNLIQRLWFKNIKMDNVDRIAVETQRPEIVLSTGSRSAPKITSFGYDVPECPSYRVPCATSVPEITEETPNVPVVHSAQCARSQSESSLCTCSASGGSGGNGSGPGSGLTYAVVHASDYRPPVCGCLKFTAVETHASDESSDETGEKHEEQQKREPQEKRGSQPLRNGKGGSKKKLTFSDDDEKILDYAEMEPEPVCEKPYCPLFHQLIILAVLIVLLSLAVAFHTIYEFTHPKKYASPVNISVYHNSLNY